MMSGSCRVLRIPDRWSLLSLLAVILLVAFLFINQSRFAEHSSGGEYQLVSPPPPRPSEDLCDVHCVKGVPCQYKDEVDLRIIVLTFDRPESLRKCLKRVSQLDTLDDEVVVDIWIDRARNGSINAGTLKVARDFKRTWKRGRACVHEQRENAYIIGQWIDTWRPREGTREIGLILEDDIDVSKFAYKWLKHVQRHFHNQTDIAGYTLQMENVHFVKGKYTPAFGPRNDTIFLHHMPNTWGFSPHPARWREFQDWFHKQREDNSFQPFIPGTVVNNWYRSFLKSGRQDSMWEMWMTHYFHYQNKFTVCSNLVKFTGRKDVLLDTNRKEKGLHFSKSQARDNSANLMKDWDPSYVRFPSKAARYGLDAKIID